MSEQQTNASVVPPPIILDQQTRRWLPAIIAAIIAFAMFIILGATPPIRAAGMAMAVVGMALALHPMGTGLAFVGGLALAFSPSFWIQTGGLESLDPLEVGIGLGVALALAGIVYVVRKHPQDVTLATILFIALFALFFLLGVGTPRSLRLTTLLAAWFVFLLTEGTLLSNPRPDVMQPEKLGIQHTWGLLLLLGLGVMNNPLFTLFVPATALGLFLTRARLPIWYWLGLVLVAIMGAYSITITYITPEWWSFPSEQTPNVVGHVPFLIASAWRDPERWLRLIDLIVGQFTPIGLALGILGLARLSRWHPPTGVVTMVAYGSYAFFGLIYFGDDAPVLLLPLLMIQIYWMTYAAYTFASWLGGAFHITPRLSLWGATAAFSLLPLFMLARIMGFL